MTTRKYKRKTKEEIIRKGPIAFPRRGRVSGGRGKGGGRETGGGDRQGLWGRSEGLGEGCLGTLSRLAGTAREAWVLRVTLQLLYVRQTQLIGGLFCR